MNNLEKIKAAVKTGGIDAVMITSESNRQYATGFHSSAGVVVVTADNAWFFTDSRYIEAAANAIDGAEVLIADREEPYSKRINKIIGDAGIKTLGFEDERLTYAEYMEWTGKLTAKLRPAQQVLSGLRAVKSREDLDGLILVQRIAEKAFGELLPLVSEKITERELAAELVYKMMKNGADDKSFDPIVVSGERSSMPHGVPTDARIQKGFLTIDFGARKNGWCSDTTRTLCVGKPDEEMDQIYHTVLNAQLAGIAAARAGVKGSAIDGAARRVIDEAGYGKFFGHGFGHGLGLEVHETPSAGPSYDKEIPEGAVISAEPGIYIPGKYGVRIEDVVYVTKDGCENITNLPKALLVV
ncbi:Xaa-Pro aminopeptidase [Sporobacter termitidis DSM 10068]|uniref:Xaa-Pro aminopeptidase n=1 Tax=Sporobacter termitidis DSM 10068 TaxID=1123282 RepID=A0A1M5WZW7_9FIRM|nr:Xaa-Pro peptidase family protein [Sporobacter termitidis]SHH93206.1 Xaa-Pro aminopeptidase [Sporobacter termitidis DSM 10068]